MGDIIISLEKVQEQADEYGHSFERELAYLTIHGMLHILGYDHMEPDDKAEMRKEEEFILQRLAMSRRRRIIREELRYLWNHLNRVSSPSSAARMSAKSTLINRIIKHKVSIVSDKAQTTRNRILCIHTDDECQIVFLDTPGIHKPKHKLGEFMDEAAYQSLRDIDAVLFLISGNEKKGPGDLFVLDKLKDVGVPVFLIINKVDLMTKEEILHKITEYAELYPFAQVIPISALKGDNVDAVVDELRKILPEGPKYFPDDMITDQPERLLVAEIVREKLFRCTRDEVPHAIAVYVEE